MRSRTVVLFVVTGFVMLCGLLVMDAVRSKRAPALLPLAAEAAQDTADTAAPETSAAAAADDTVAPSTEPAAAATAVEAMPVVYPNLTAFNPPAESTVTLGAVYPDIKRTADETRYKFKVELTTLGASVKSAVLSEFDNRHPKDRKPLELLSPLSKIGRASWRERV